MEVFEAGEKITVGLVENFLEMFPIAFTIDIIIYNM